MGSVHPYETKAGKKLYRIIYRRPDHSQTSERGFTRRRDAELRLAEVEVSKGRGEYVDPADARATLGTLGTDWLKSRGADLKPSTYRTTESTWRVHVEPKWGSRAIGGIRHSEVQTWIAGLAKTRSATTVRRAHEILAGILDVAVRDRRVARNVARGVKLPRKAGKARAYLTHEQVASLATGAKYPALVVFLAYTGLRWGEATGLRVKHIDTARRRVSVEENAVEVGSIIEIGTPKTHERRQVRYPAFLADTVELLAAGKSADALLFGDGIMHVRRPKATTGWFNGAVTAAQARAQKAIEDAKERGEDEPPTFPRVTPHDLRHTAASLAISAGANVKAVQRMLGHASAAMTLDTYADLFDDDLDAVADALDKAAASSTVASVLPQKPSNEEEEGVDPSVS
ncbi:tyrosine-type recombinase/integrase [Microbacterium sp. S308A+]